MEIFGYIKSELDITIIFGYQYIGARVCGYKKGCEGNVFLGNVKQDGRIIIPKSIFNNFDGLQLNDEKIELAES